MHCVPPTLLRAICFASHLHIACVLSLRVSYRVLPCATSACMLPLTSACAPPGACFELFGFDVMLDHDARPWLIEVNVSPDLASSSPLDTALKVCH